MAININRLWTEKTEKLSDKIRAIVRGDDDFYQEGLLGIREGLLRNPNATDAYLTSGSNMDWFKPAEPIFAESAYEYIEAN